MTGAKHYTWTEMYSYLRKQENCRVNGNGFVVIDLYKFLDKMNDAIECFPLDKRNGNNIQCKTLKRTLQKVYLAYLNGDIDPAGTIKTERKFSIYHT